MHLTWVPFLPLFPRCQVNLIVRGKSGYDKDDKGRAYLKIEWFFFLLFLNQRQISVAA